MIDVANEPLDGWPLPGGVPGLITDLVLSPDDRNLSLSNWLHGELRHYDVNNPASPRLPSQTWLGGLLGRDGGHPRADGPLAAGRGFLRSAADGVSQRPADLRHAGTREQRDTTPEGFTGHGVEIVEVDHASRRNAVIARRCSSSDTKPRRVLVRAAATTDPMRSATGSRVNTSTGRSPPGVAANQISPRCIVPVGPILGWTPVCNALERSLGIRQGRSCPRLGIVLAAQADQVPMESVAENLRAVHPKRLRPALNLSRLIIRHTKAEHRHTA